PDQDTVRDREAIEDLPGLNLHQLTRGEVPAQEALTLVSRSPTAHQGASPGIRSPVLPGVSLRPHPGVLADHPRAKAALALHDHHGHVARLDVGPTRGASVPDPEAALMRCGEAAQGSGDLPGPGVRERVDRGPPEVWI